MPHSKDVKRLMYSENPPEPAPAYPGRWSRNNTSGSTLTWQEFVQEETDQWLKYVIKSPSYSITYMADKIKCLMQHLRFTKKSKLTQLQLRALIESAESRLLTKFSPDQEDPFEIKQKNVQKPELVGTKSDGNEEKEMLWGDMIELEEDDSKDKNWSREEENNKRFKGRGKREMKVEKLLSMSDKDIFEGTDMDESDFEILNFNQRFIERREKYGRNICEKMSDQQLFMGSHKINKHVIETHAFKERKKLFCDMFLEEESSRDILHKESDTPKVVVESSEFDSRLKHLTRKEKSEVVSLCEVKKTIKLLRQIPGKEAKDQIKIIAASLTSEKYGVPELDFNWREEKVISEMKTRLLSGQDNILTVPQKKTRKVLPTAVADIATKYWELITTLEPSKHRHLKTVVMDGSEAIPTRYQTTTDEEAYQGFQEKCSEEIMEIMTKHGQEMYEKFSTRRDSRDKEYKLRHALELGKKFPSKTWFLGQRPPEVKMINDHTTGLCKVSSLMFRLFQYLPQQMCESIRVNYEKYVKEMKKLCRCRTKICHNWECTCTGKVI